MTKESNWTLVLSTRKVYDLEGAILTDLERPCPRPPLPGVSPHLSNPARAFHIDPVPFPLEDDPAERSFSVDVFLHVTDLFPLAAVLEAMDDAGGVAQERSHDSSLDNNVHIPDLR